MFKQRLRAEASERLDAALNCRRGTCGKIPAGGGRKPQSGVAAAAAGTTCSRAVVGNVVLIIHKQRSASPSSQDLAQRAKCILGIHKSFHSNTLSEFNAYVAGFVSVFLSLVAKQKNNTTYVQTRKKTGFLRTIPLMDRYR